MHSKPLILITPSTTASGAEFSDFSLSLSMPYSSAIAAAGGLPCIFSQVPSPAVAAESVRRADGILLTGGDDVQPELYTKDTQSPAAKLVKPAHPERDFAELLVIRETFLQRKPLLAICRGHQLLNVSLGGTLFMDLPRQAPGEVNHNPKAAKGAFVHQITLAHGSLLAAIFKREKLWVNSSHHQAVDQVATPFWPAASSPDGIVEAIELQPADRHLLPFCLSIQFHPERLIERHPEFLLLFKSFVRACTAQAAKGV